MRPFSIALALLAGLVPLELMMLMLGGSILAGEVDGRDFDAELDLADTPDGGDLVPSPGDFSVAG